MKKHTETSVHFGSITLPVAKSMTPFIPPVIAYKENAKTLETIAYAISENIPVLLIGETGVGKTSAIRHIAAKTNNSLRRVNVNGTTTAEDFVGQLLVNAEGTYWKDGVLTEAMRNGYWLVIDEINAASADVLFALHSLLDDDRYIVLTDSPNREIVRPHKNFRVFATMNPPERYAGTKELNKALMSRFPITLNVPIPNQTIEYGAISGASKVLDKDELSNFKNFVEDLRKIYDKEEIEIFISPRDIAHIIKAYAFTANLQKAVEITVQARGTKAEQKAIYDLCRLHFGEKKAEVVPEVVILDEATA